MPERAAIAIGSNVPWCGVASRDMIELAIVALRATSGIDVVLASTVHTTAPVGPPDQPAYANAAVKVTTDLEPRGLLREMLRIEAEHGRERSRETRWGPRTLDLDLLLFSNRQTSTRDLTVPHPRLAERLFVLEPLAEIASDWHVSGEDATVVELRDRRRAIESAGAATENPGTGVA